MIKKREQTVSDAIECDDNGLETLSDLVCSDTHHGPLASRDVDLFTGFTELLTEVFAVFVIFFASDQFDGVLADCHSLAADGQLHHDSSVVCIDAFDLRGDEGNVRESAAQK